MTKLSPDLLYNELLINFVTELINLRIIKNHAEAVRALKIKRPSFDRYLTFTNRVSAKKYILYLERLLDYLSSKTKEYQLLNDGITEMKIKLTIEKKKFSQSPENKKQ